MNIRKIFLILILLYFNSAFAQQLRPAPATDIYGKIQRLNTLLNVMYIAAHPDDENTRLLSWLANGEHASTIYLSLTRGDGGQNIIGSEQGAALGLIRTYELLEARKIDGAQQLFSRAIDFGFSKTKEETFTHWNADLLTRDVVWSIRKYRPDVIICRFPPDTRAGHGHHAASAVIAHAAFRAAADKKRYPDQLNKFDAWQPERILFNTFRFGSNNTINDNQLKINTGQYNAGLGEGYGELAGRSRSMHHSQGVGTPSTPGIQQEYFELVDGKPAKSSLFDNIDITWGRIARKDIGNDIAQVLKNYNYGDPSASVVTLLNIRQKIAQLADPFWRQVKLREIDEIILDCCGFMAELVTTKQEATAGQALNFQLNAIARGQSNIRLQGLTWQDQILPINTALDADILFSKSNSLRLPDSTSLTEPYWLAKSPTDISHYTIPDEKLTGVPDMHSTPQAGLTLTVDSRKFEVSLPLSYKHLDPIKGDITEPLRIVPAVITGFTQPLFINESGKPVNTAVHIKTIEALKNARIVIKQDTKVLSSLENINLPAGTDTVYQLQIPAGLLSVKGNERARLLLSVETATQRFNKTQHLILYDHIPALQYFSTASANVIAKNWNIYTGKVGFIQGAGDYTADFLRQAGLNVVTLKEIDFASAEALKDFDVIITGVRSVNVEKRMQYWLPVLMQYVHNGGRLVMQYNTVQELATTKMGPYPFSISTKRVTEEDADVQFTNTSSPLLLSPNKITQTDFDNWVQERGLYFADTWDDHYKTLFSMHDKDESPLAGATLYCNYGKGTYIYTSLSFFRQLPAGNVGAIRLLMNFLSKDKQPK